ncbi:MBOAT family protein [Pelotomaculum terephthalicicum JT]|nr:MBOAT family protein [Pelotomaculum terephthalicicum JT]
MVFSSLFFLFAFLPLVLLLYYTVPHRYRNFILFVSSLIFYAWGEPVYILLMFFSTLINYAHGLLLTRSGEKKNKSRLVLISALATNLGLLCFYKYYDFLLESINSVLGTSLAVLGLPLPLGISFYTFKAISYIIDLYRGAGPAPRNFIDFGTYVSLFPQLLAGPIVRYQTVSAQLRQRREGFAGFGEGVRRFVAGLGKKVLLANNLGFFWAQIQQAPPSELTVCTAWLGIIAFALHIYFDFSGYSDMAIGLGKMFGFTFPENFQYPYISQSITEFWRRWHISLGTWFRDYVYLPLGGNRSGKLALYRNLFLVWFLTGLWHGASWNFVLWGLYYGLILALEKTFLFKWLSLAPRCLCHAYAVLLILLGWVLFAFAHLPAGLAYLQVLFGLHGRGFCDQQALYYLSTQVVLILIASLASTPFSKHVQEKLLARSAACYYTAATLSCLMVLLLSTAYLVDSTYNPFFYFRF